MFSKDGKVKDVKTPRICDVVWHDGEFINWNDAKVHVMSHVLHYGSSIFEGIRCYATNQGPAVFRLREHMQRFLNSAKIYRMDHPWKLDQLCDAAEDRAFFPQMLLCNYFSNAGTQRNMCQRVHPLQSIRNKLQIRA